MIYGIIYLIARRYINTMTISNQYINTLYPTFIIITYFYFRILFSKYILAFIYTDFLILLNLLSQKIYILECFGH